MSAVIPAMRFSPDETPWARWAEGVIIALQQENEMRTQNDTNINQGQSATISALGQSIRDLNTTIANQKALAQPASFNASGMALPAGGTSYTTFLVVPPNMTQCAYVMHVYGSGINSTAGNSFLGVTIQAPGSGAATAPAAAGTSAYTTMGATGLMVGLTPGQTLNFQAMIYSTGSWAANAVNSMRIQVLGTFMP